MTELQTYLTKLNDLQSPPPSPAETLNLLETYPYFSLLGLAWLRRTWNEGMLYDMPSRRKIAARVLLANPSLGSDYRFLINDLTGGYDTDEDLFPQEKIHEPDTNEAIDLFLDTYSKTNDNEKETEILEQLIFHPVADYASILEAQEEKDNPDADEAAEGTDDAIINKFIIDDKAKGHRPSTISRQEGSTPNPVPEKTALKKISARQEDVLLQESLAKMHIMRKNYSAAHEILNRLNLNYPEKNIYFAVQLRFLEKLMLNESLKSQSNTSSLNN